MLKNTLTLLEEERKDLKEFAKKKINKVKDKTKTKVDGIFEKLKKLVCPKKVKRV